MLAVAPIQIRPGDLVVQDPTAQKVYRFDWNREHLPVGVTIDSSTFTITAVRPAGDTALVKDNELIESGERKTWLRLSAGTLGAMYEVSNRIVTNEAPAQTKELSFYLLIQHT